MDIRVRVDGEAEEQDASDHGGDGHGALAANVRDLDGVAGKNRARDADYGGNGVVAVGDVAGVLLFTAGVLDVLRQECVEKRVSHANGGPAEPEKHGGDTHSLVGEERADALQRELLESPSDDLHGGQRLLFARLLGIAPNLIEDFLGQPGLGLVLVGDCLDGCHGFGLAAVSKEELGGLVKMEEEEAANEHAKGQGTQGENQISPAHIVFPSAASFSICDAVAGGQAFSTAVRGDVRPGEQTGGTVSKAETRKTEAINQPSNEITDWPEHTQHSKKVARGERQEFQEECTVNGQVSTYTQAQARTQGTNTVIALDKIMIGTDLPRAYPIQVGPPPAARPKAPQMKRVKLKAGRRPIRSEIIPQKEAPRQRPKNREHVVKRTQDDETPNSDDSGGNVRAIPCNSSASWYKPLKVAAK